MPKDTQISVRVGTFEALKEKLGNRQVGPFVDDLINRWLDEHEGAKVVIDVDNLQAPPDETPERKREGRWFPATEAEWKRWADISADPAIGKDPFHAPECDCPKCETATAKIRARFG